jgi:hypothetical protein
MTILASTGKPNCIRTSFVTRFIAPSRSSSSLIRASRNSLSSCVGRPLTLATVTLSSQHGPILGSNTGNTAHQVKMQDLKRPRIKFRCNTTNTAHQYSQVSWASRHADTSRRRTSRCTSLLRSSAASLACISCSRACSIAFWSVPWNTCTSIQKQ